MGSGASNYITSDLRDIQTPPRRTSSRWLLPAVLALVAFTGFGTYLYTSSVEADYEARAVRYSNEAIDCLASTEPVPYVDTAGECQAEIKAVATLSEPFAAKHKWSLACGLSLAVFVLAWRGGVAIERGNP